MSLPESFVFSLQDSDAGSPVDLVFRGDITAEQIDRAEEVWRPQFHQLRAAAIDRGVAPDDVPAEHGEWDWRAKRQEADERSFFFGVLFDDEMQALVMCSVGRKCRLPTQKDLPLVFVDSLEVAPWNQPLLREPRRFAAIGSLLLEQVIEFSRSLGCEGRIGLASLKQAASFYRKCGMTDYGLEQFGAGIYRYFEMTPQQASRFVEGWQ